jgi:multidrug efflux pump subunit AcrA (membrane-fusion protein)
MRVRNAVLTLGSLAALCTAGCAATATPGTGVVYAPDRVVHVSTNLNRVILNAQSADRLGIVTKPVLRLAGSGVSVVPVSSVLYDKDGGTWVYTDLSAFTYVRAAVVLGPIDNDMWELTSGPAPGTEVVTVGGAELLGAEQGVEGE